MAEAEGEKQPGLIEFLRTMRRPQSEVQWTQMIAAAARADSRFAGRLASVLVDAAPNGTARPQLGPIPQRLECTAEVDLGPGLGRVDLRFLDHEGGFELLVELKLGATYGSRQLERYLEALDASGAENRALIAVTSVAEHFGEEEVSSDPRWLGSIRWREVFNQLRNLGHASAPLGHAWRAGLDLLRQQGDFGPMDLDRAAVEAWARRDDAEAILRYLLGELAEPVLLHLQEHLRVDASAALIHRGKSAVIWPWRNQMHVKYAVLAPHSEERLRIQFLASGGRAFFTVEARYQHPKEHLAGAHAVDAATRVLDPDFATGNDGFGYYWARLFESDTWLNEDRTLDTLLALAYQAVDQLAVSGIFDALAQVQPTTPVSAAPQSSQE